MQRESGITKRAARPARWIFPSDVAGRATASSEQQSATSFVAKANPAVGRRVPCKNWRMAGCTLLATRDCGRTRRTLEERKQRPPIRATRPAGWLVNRQASSEPSRRAEYEGPREVSDVQVATSRRARVF